MQLKIGTWSSQRLVKAGTATISLGEHQEKKKKNSKASWNFAKDPANFEDLIPHWTYAERVQFSGQMRALG